MPVPVADHDTSDHRWLHPIEFGSRQEERHRELVAEPMIRRRSTVLQLASFIVVPGGIEELSDPRIAEVCLVQHRCLPLLVLVTVCAPGAQGSDRNAFLLRIVTTAGCCRPGRAPRGQRP